MIRGFYKNLVIPFKILQILNFNFSDQVEGINSRTKVGTSNDSISKMQLRKYETMKKMILYLHDSQDREWGRYCPYGCHCMVNGPNDILSGHGNPVDEIDSACKRHQECIACAMNVSIF